MAEKKVEYAMVYDSWFPVTPKNWIKVAELKLPGRKVTPASDVVSFYATSPSSAGRLLEAISRYTLDNPSKSGMLAILLTQSLRTGAPPSHNPG